MSEVAELQRTIQQMHDACQCSRNTYGFDYGETHPTLGKPMTGARWLTPRDIAGFLMRRWAANAQAAEAQKERKP